MLQLHSIAGRVFTGMMVGVVIGLITMLFLPTFGHPGFGALGLGTLIMFILMGAMTGFIGIFDRHPVFNFKMSWWKSGAIVGVVFMTMYVFLSYSAIDAMMQSTLISWTGFTSPFWAILDGVWIGMLMSFIEMKLAGKGTELPVQ